MALAKKGRRNLEIQGERYRWVVGRRRQYRSGGNDANLWLTLVVQHAEGDGRRLEAEFRGELSSAVPAKGFRDDQTLTVTPAIVRTVVERALALGWKPREPGPALRLHNQELEYPESSKPLIGDRRYDAARLDEYLQGATLISSKGS